jgi:polyhydroxyalkanoate synthase
MTDLMVWNADATRLPYRMHSEYLRHLFLDNDLAEGRLLVEGKPVALADIRAPVFSVGTSRDHVSPWRSTYQIHLQTETEVTYLLASGGHNVGIVSQPGGDPREAFQVMTKRPEDRYLDPDTFLARAPQQAGSWWPQWSDWLAARSGAHIRAGQSAADGLEPLGDAPGSYVLQP